jgi:5-methylthioadenosine/S-adenosylhomocysteine deaminase
LTLAVTGATLEGEAVGLRCEDGQIAEIGPQVTPAVGDEVLDAGGGALVPPLVNGHTHAAMTLFRGYGDDLPLMRWLQEKIWPVEKRLEPEDVYWGARLACVEMIRTGTARFWDTYWHPGATARAVADSGLRAVIGLPLIDAMPGPAGLREAAMESLDEVGGYGPMALPSLTPHAIYTAGSESLAWIAERRRDLGVPLQIHLSETEQEVEDCLREHGERPAQYLDRLGLLGERTLLAHGVWLDRSELELIAERGATVVSNPVANQKLAVGGVFPYPAAREAGVAVGIGTDGAGSNNSLDLLADAKAFALIQKHAAGDAAAVDARETWEVATGARAPLLGAGRLSAGQPADFLLLRPGAYELALGDPQAALVYAASGSVVDATVVAGRVLMRDGHVPEADEVIARAAERAEGLGLRRAEPA